MGKLDRTWSVVRAVVSEMRREDVTFMAGSIAYHAFVSMLPVLFLLVLAVSVFASEAFVTTVIGLTESVLPDLGRRVVTDALDNARGSVSLSVVGVGVLLWGTFKIFRAMDAAFAEIYDTERKLSLLDQFRDALVVFLTVTAVVGGAVVFGTVVRIPPTVPFSGLLGDLIGFVGLAAAFLPIYYLFPNTDVSVREVVPGVLVATVGWRALEWLFHLYVGVTRKPDVFGLVGTLILLVTWLYAGSLLLLVGASINATLAGRNRTRRAEQVDKRRFGRVITDADSFEGHLDELVAQADDADVSDEEVRRILRRRGETAGESDGERGLARRERTARREPDDREGEAERNREREQERERGQG